MLFWLRYAVGMLIILVGEKEDPEDGEERKIELLERGWGRCV